MSTEVEQFWEQHYGAAEQVWSGRANATLVDVVQDLAPGTALDLGCGEGGDAVWLALRGWQVTGVDVTPTALRRAEHTRRRRASPTACAWSGTSSAARSPTGRTTS